MEEITKGNGEMTPVQSFRDSALFSRGGNTYFRSGWGGGGWNSLVIGMTLEKEIYLGIIVMLLYPMRAAILLLLLD